MFYQVKWNYFAHSRKMFHFTHKHLQLLDLFFLCKSVFHCLLWHYRLSKLSVLYSSAFYKSGPWMMWQYAVYAKHV